MSSSAEQPASKTEPKTGAAHPRQAYLLLALASLFWSVNHIVGRAIGGHVPPLALSFLRWLIPIAVLWLIARPHLRHEWKDIRRHWIVLVWLAATGGALFTVLQYVGLQYTSALNVSVFNSLVPVLIVAASGALFRERIAPLQLAGIVVSSTGVLVVIAHGTLETLAQLNFNWGDLIIVLNMAVFAIYAACLRLRPPMHWSSFLFVIAVVSTVGTLPFFLQEIASGYTLKADWITFGAIAYVSVFPSVLSFAAWNRGVELIGANRSGPFLHLIPIYTALLAGTLLGEHLAWYHAAGFALILIGVWLASVRPSGKRG
jgi:drug/metabolite transporter (DMT)-like permease